MKLQILIPQYEETDEVVKPLLDSIAIQQSVNFDDIGVIIVNDGSDVHLSNSLLKSYPYKVEYYLEEHRGVSGTRNACFEHATADYVMFCDADDMFCNVCGLWIIFREIENGGFDSLVSVFVEESHLPQDMPEQRNPQGQVIQPAMKKGDILYINHDMDSTFVHGKIHRRQYLLDQNIRWNEKLTIHEDSFFNIQCQNLSQNVKYCPMPFYLWKWRGDSVCRHDPKYILKTYNNMLDSNDALIDEFLKRGIQDKAMFYTCFMIFDAYYTMNKPEWINQENKEYRDKTELRFADYFVKRRDLWKAVPDPDKMQISNQVRARSVTEGMRMEAITIDGWLKKVLRMRANFNAERKAAKKAKKSKKSDEDKTESVS